MTKKNWKLFEDICFSADVVDVDFSRWDEKISLYVLAENVDKRGLDMCALMLVEFEVVEEFHFYREPKSRHPEYANSHPTWTISDLQYKKDKGRLFIDLKGSSDDPALRIICKHIQIHVIPHAYFDETFPDWHEDGALGRPSIDRIYRRFVNDD